MQVYTRTQMRRRFQSTCVYETWLSNMTFKYDSQIPKDTYNSTHWLAPQSKSGSTSNQPGSSTAYYAKVHKLYTKRFCSFMQAQLLIYAALLGAIWDCIILCGLLLR
jgi:hypothetical protein